MSLISTNRPIFLLRSDPWSVGVWMRIENGTANDLIWVTVTHECLPALDPNKIIDQFSALEILEDKRALLEQIAREKYDTKGTHPADGLYEGKPILRIYPEDLPSEQRKPG
jgi:hypothetical protein